ncbi:hypothetical protein [Anaerovibrio lipolyticus]|uniref:hypothetical protein n=1 Tax=Anaerovibrio lipolyticus TaxID=82374 RepID=UPI0004817640|nr:hypothetical protein [Anaerovibrio lipolyticus]
MIRRFIASLVFMCSLMMMFAVGYAANDSAEWYWISSDDKYSKFYAPGKVQVLRSFGNIAVQISAWTKTTYSPAGAQETLNNYGIKDINPGQLAYSLAEVEVNPQNRTLAYLNESFYDKDDNKLWEKVYSPVRPKEMNSQEFDEDFYCYIVDSIFSQGENERRKADDRWLQLWQDAPNGGGVVYSMADTSTMRLKGQNIIFWEWQEKKSSASEVESIIFQKKAVNIPMYTEKVIRVMTWNATTGWKDITNTTDGMYHVIEAGTNSEKALKALKVYEGGHESWVKRYSLDNE